MIRAQDQVKRPKEDKGVDATGATTPFLVMFFDMNRLSRTLGFLIVSFFFAGPTIASVKTGLLTVETNCLTPEGCGNRFKLWDEKLKNFTSLSESNFQGQQVQSLNGRVVTLHSRKGVETLSVKRHSSLPFHEFLIEQADLFTSKYAPCMAGWDKSYSWELKQRHTAILKVTLTNDDGQKFLTLTYNGRSGRLLNEGQAKQARHLCR